MLSVPKHNTKVVDSIVAGFLGNVIIPVADQKKSILWPGLFRV